MHYIPVYKRPPNRFLRFEEVRIDDGVGHTGIKIEAYFIDKKGNTQSMTAQIIWDK